MPKQPENESRKRRSLELPTREEPQGQSEFRDCDRRGEREEARFGKGLVRAQDAGEASNVGELPEGRREENEPEEDAQPERETLHGFGSVESGVLLSVQS